MALLHGEAGIGKTRPVGWTLDRAAGGARTLYAAGTPTERDLPFAGLHQLLRPVLEEASQRRTVGRVPEALAAEAAAGTTLFRTAMVVLDLLAEVAAEVLCRRADDVQWRDRPSRDVLSSSGGDSATTRSR